MTATLKELVLDFEKLEAVRECRNAMSRAVFYYSSFRMNDYVKLWANRDDCTLETPWGCYDGIRGVKTCLLRDHGDRSDWETQELIKGCLLVRSLDTELIVVAEDGKTARGVWNSQGAETYGKNIIKEEYRNAKLLVL